MKMYGGVGVQIYVFLTLALAGGVWSASHPSHFTPGERASGTLWIGGWVDPRTGQDDVERRQILPLPGFELDLSTIQPVASHYADCAIPAPL
jgi:hypothetical protein